jgi:hypothetical protein
VTRQEALRPGEYNVYDAHGRLFTTANLRGYATRLAARLDGHVTITLFGEEHPLDENGIARPVETDQPTN